MPEQKRLRLEQRTECSCTRGSVSVHSNMAMFAIIARAWKTWSRGIVCSGMGRAGTPKNLLTTEALGGSAAFAAFTVVKSAFHACLLVVRILFTPKNYPILKRATKNPTTATKSPLQAITNLLSYQKMTRMSSRRVFPEAPSSPEK